MSLRIIVPPTELITVAEAAEFMRIDDNGDSPKTYPEEMLIENLITTARQWCEEYLRRSIGVQTLELVLERFPRIILLRPPVISITSLKYLDENNDEQTLIEDNDFYAAIDSEPAEIKAVSGWPTTLNIGNAVRVRYQAGYSDGSSPMLSPQLPKTIRTAILMIVSDSYHNREAQTEKPLTVNSAVERLLSTYRLEMGI
jgi:uncharacterized phiE125 gp8 family phage protein